MAVKHANKYALFDSLASEPMPFKPKAGKSFIYKWSDDACKDDWKGDGYRWRQNGSFRELKLNVGAMYFKDILILFTKHLRVL